MRITRHAYIIRPWDSYVEMSRFHETIQKEYDKKIKIGTSVRCARALDRFPLRNNKNVCV